MKIILLVACLTFIAMGDISQLSDEEFAYQYLLPFNEDEAAFVPFGDESITGLPDSIDWRDISPECVHDILDQGACGSCWAFAVSETASDRYCLATGGKVNHVFSPQYLVDCDNNVFARACNGAITITVIDWVKRHGIVTDNCYPYVSGTTHEAGECHLGECDAESTETWKKYNFDSRKIWLKMSYSKVMKDLVENGPVFLSMNVYSGLRTVGNDVYVQKDDEQKLGGHAVKVIGYGVMTDEEVAAQDLNPEDERRYWIVANSWGTNFGVDGFFRIRFDQDIGYQGGSITAKPEVASLLE